MHSRSARLTDPILSLLVTIGLLMPIQSNAVLVNFVLLDDGTTYGDSVAGDGMVDFTLSGLPAGASISGIINHGSGPAPGGSGVSGAFYHIQTTSLSIVNDSTTSLDYRLTFQGSTTFMPLGAITFTALNGTYDDTPGDGDGLADFVDLRANGSIDFGVANSIVDPAGVTNVADGTSFTHSALSPVPNNADSPNGSLISIFDFVVAPGSGVTLPTSLNISAAVVPIPAAAWLFGSALGLLGWLRRRTA